MKSARTTISSKIDPMKGVVKPDVLSESLRSLRDREQGARSYVVGALKYLAAHPPNPYIVPLLKHALEKFA